MTLFRRIALYLQINYPGLWIARVNLLLTIAMLWWVAAGIWTLSAMPAASRNADMSRLISIVDVYSVLTLIGAGLFIMWLVLICLRPRWHHVLGRWADLKYMVLLAGMVLLLAPAQVYTRLLADSYTRAEHQFLRDLQARAPIKDLPRVLLFQLAAKEMRTADSRLDAASSELSSGDLYDSLQSLRTRRRSPSGGPLRTDEAVLKEEYYALGALELLASPQHRHRYDAIYVKPLGKDDYTEANRDHLLRTWQSAGKGSGEFYDRFVWVIARNISRLPWAHLPMQSAVDQVGSVHQITLALCGADCARRAHAMIDEAGKSHAGNIERLRTLLAGIGVALPDRWPADRDRDEATRDEIVRHVYAALLPLSLERRLELMRQLAQVVRANLEIRVQLGVVKADLRRANGQAALLTAAHSRSGVTEAHTKALAVNLDLDAKRVFDRPDDNIQYLLLAMLACFVIALYRQTSWADVCLLSLGGITAIVGLLSLTALPTVAQSLVPEWLLVTSFEETPMARLLEMQRQHASARSSAQAIEELGQLGCLHASLARLSFGLVWLAAYGFPLFLVAGIAVYTSKRSRISRRLRMVMMSMCLALPVSLQLLASTPTPFCGLDQRIVSTNPRTAPKTTMHQVSMADYLQLKAVTKAVWWVPGSELTLAFTIYVVLLLLWDVFWRYLRKLYLLPQ